MKTYKAKGIVLHTVRYGDSSLIVYMLTDISGRQTYMVQGVKSSKGRGNKAALFQPMFLLDFEGFESSRLQMHRLKDARMSVPYSSVPFDITKSTISLFMAEVLYKLVREAEANSPLFDFVRASMEALDNMRDGVANFHLWFLVGLSSFLGFYPGNEYNPGEYFDIKEGVFTSTKPDHLISLDKENSAILDRFMNSEVYKLDSIKLIRTQRSGFLSSLINYYGYHLDIMNEIKSLQILRDVF